MSTSPGGADVLPISVCVITRNEERHLRDCLRSVRDHVDEIVVLDSLSTDWTQVIAREFTDRVFEQPFADFSSQKNRCVELASHDWVLVLDADERMEPNAWPLLKALFAGGREPEFVAYAFPRRTISADGRFHLWVNHYPSLVDRLYDRRRCRYVKEVHETLEIGGKRGFIPSHILHLPKEGRESVEEKGRLYEALKGRMRLRLGGRLEAPRPLGEKIRTKWESLLFHTRAMLGGLKLHRKGPAYWGFLLRWYVVFFCPPLRILTKRAGRAEVPPWFGWFWFLQTICPVIFLGYAAVRRAKGPPFDALIWVLVGLCVAWIAGVALSVATQAGREWLASRWPKVAAASGLFLGALVISDLALTLTGKVPTAQEMRDHAFLYRPSVYTAHRLVPDHTRVDRSPERTIRINHAGLRGPELRVKKVPGVLRVIVLGGSQAFGINGPDWPRLAGERLSSRGLKVEVINAAVPAFKSADCLGEFSTWLWMLDPDVVVLCEEWNDIKYFEGMDPEHPYYDLVKPYAYSWMPDPRGLDEWLCISSLYRLVRLDLLQSLYGPEGEAPRPATGRASEWGARQYRVNVRAICDMGKDLGVAVVLCKQARLLTEAMTEDSRRRTRRSLVGLSYEEIVRAFRMCDRVLEGAAADKGCTLIDMHAPLSGCADYFDDQIHFTVEGSRHAAEVMADALEPLLRGFGR